MAITINHAENCTFIEKQIVEKQVVEKMYVQNQSIESQKPQSDSPAINMQDHPLWKYIVLNEKGQIIIECLTSLVKSRTHPKDQLAPIKAAMEYKPMLLSQDITIESINNEFGLQISQDTFNNWIKGYHNCKYDDSELEVFKENFDYQIMGKNVNSGL